MNKEVLRSNILELEFGTFKLETVKYSYIEEVVGVEIFPLMLILEKT